MKNVIVVSAILGVLALFEGIWYLIQSFSERKKAELRRRLSLLTEDTLGSAEGPQILRRGRFAESPALDSFLRSFELAARLEHLLDQTDLELTVAQILGASLALFFFPFAGLTLFSQNLMGGLVLGTLLATLPFFYVFRARRKRMEQISAQLPEALEMMSRSLRAGHALPSAFQLVARELPPPIATEFAKAYEEQKLGKSLEEAVQNMVERVPRNLDLKIFAVMVIIQKETGGNLIELLEGIAGTIRERYNFYGKLKIMTAEGRSAAAILCAIPFVVVGALLLFNPGYLSPLISDPLGNVLLLLGGLSMAVGVFIMSKMVQIEV